MNSDLQYLANTLFYNDKLEPGSDTVGTRRLHFTNVAALPHGPKWLAEVVSINSGVAFIDTSSGVTGLCCMEDEGGVTNIGEARIISELAATIQKGGVFDIAIISPYRKQLAVLKQECAAGFRVTL